jgi:pimeloyl-ACP methyl ester carboxylesterase
MKIQSGYAEINDVRLFYEISGEGEPLVLIHGNVGDRRIWDDQFEILAEKYKAIRYDSRGFGKSSLPNQDDPYSFHEDLRALLNYLGITRTHLLGLSMGSGVAIDFVLSYPEMSSSLITAGPWIFGFSSQELISLFEVINALACERGIKIALNHWLKAPFLKHTMRNNHVANRLKEIVFEYSGWHFINEDPIRFLTPTALLQLDNINLPTLIITSDYDLKDCKEIADLLESKIPNAKKVVIADAAHMMNIEKPTKFNEIVLEFLGDIADT